MLVITEYVEHQLTRHEKTYQVLAPVFVDDVSVSQYKLVGVLDNGGHLIEVSSADAELIESVVP